jgi:hypothetical protein
MLCWNLHSRNRARARLRAVLLPQAHTHTLHHGQSGTLVQPIVFKKRTNCGRHDSDTPSTHLKHLKKLLRCWRGSPWWTVSL